MNVNIGLAQIRPRLGDVAANLAAHLDYVERAATQGVELLLFPELSLTGYTLEDLAFDVAAHPQPDDPVFGPLLDASRRLDLLVGFVDEDTRHQIYIAQAYLSQGRVLHVHRKVYLPTYALFDEGRYFAWGNAIRAFDTRFGRVGVLICEDFWHASPPYLLWLDGADILLLCSASPGRGLGYDGKLASSRWVELVNQSYASLFTNFVVHCNRVGYEDGVNFWGGSTVFDPNGDLVTQGPYFEEALVTATLELGRTRQVRARLPLLRDERVSLTYREMRRILGEINDTEVHF
jgi:NAD+ synthase (glutamine-hydrolysing)